MADKDSLDLRVHARTEREWAANIPALVPKLWETQSSALPGLSASYPLVSFAHEY